MASTDWLTTSKWVAPIWHPSTLFSVTGYAFFGLNHSFAVSHDDQRFVMLRQLGSIDRELFVTFNFFEELKRLAPAE